MSKKKTDTGGVKDAVFRISGSRAIEQANESVNAQVVRIYMQAHPKTKFDLKPEILKSNAFEKVDIQPKDWERELQVSSRYRVAADINFRCEKSVKSLIRGAEANGFSELSVVALDQIQDPQNVGSIIRSAAFFGFEAVILLGNRSASLSDAVVRASAGALLGMKVVLASNLAREMELWKKSGGYCVGLTAHAEREISDFSPLGGSQMLVFGAEGRGLRKLTASNCDELVRIHQNREFESLNVGVAAGLAMYQMSKRSKS